ncbi:MAG: SUF system NifU family Fe-S cluster assembly protein [Gammaproteobacteria bacterium]|nr:SUF system NifU family Fe-S cluster assembly protein [Gammaproteobacteria bacterium]
MNENVALQPDLKDLYRGVVLDHARNPRHQGRLTDATHHCDGINPLCGDKLEIRLRIAKDDTIEAGGFEGTGCAISIASASLMTDAVIGRAVADAEALAKSVTLGLQHGFDTQPDPDIQDLRALEGVREFPSRVKCATLAWQALCGALRGQATPVSTE